ncbi:hypothetical protein [Escherichia phage dw-ec]|nr:hypothetical protein [Escherichia phage dw-ec]
MTSLLNNKFFFFWLIVIWRINMCRIKTFKISATFTWTVECASLMIPKRFPTMHTFKISAFSHAISPFKRLHLLKMQL